MNNNKIIVFFVLLLVAASCPKAEVDLFLTSGTNVTLSQRNIVDYVLVIDTSGSMKGDKLQKAITAAKEFINKLSGDDNIAIISFDNDANLVHPLSNNKLSLLSSLSDVSIGDFTSYTPALKLANDVLVGGDNKVVVFLSDGKPSESSSDVINLINKYSDICFFTVAYASSADLQAQDLLKKMADTSLNNSGCGGYFRSDENAYVLSSIFESIYTETSSYNVFDVNVDIDSSNPVSIDVIISSKYNGALVNNACFEPVVDLNVLSNNTLVVDRVTTDTSFSFELTPGTYSYFVRVIEDCNGDCLYSGEASGSFEVVSKEFECSVPWDDINAVLSTTDFVEVLITSEGFKPQSVGTTGLVTWRNIDTVPHRVVGADGSFTSPLIQPGSTWSHVFPPGEYSYIDTESDFSGVFKNEEFSDSESIDLFLVIDTSGSMAGKPLEEARQAANALLSVLKPGDKISLIAFSDSAYTILPLSADIGRARDALKGLVAEGATNYLPAFVETFNQLKLSSTSKKAVIFLSDGMPYDSIGYEGLLKAASNYFKNTCVYTVGYGDIPLEGQYLLSELTNTGYPFCGAYYSSSTNKEELSSVFGEIYAATDNPGLEFFDVVITNDDDTITVSAKVRSSQNGLLVPSFGDYGCLPVAEVFAKVGVKTYKLSYDGDSYKTTFSLPPGEHSIFLTARIQDDSQVLKTAVGSYKAQVIVKNSSYWKFIIIITFIISCVFIIKLVGKKLR